MAGIYGSKEQFGRNFGDNVLLGNGDEDFCSKTLDDLPLDHLEVMGSSKTPWGYELPRVLVVQFGPRGRLNRLTRSEKTNLGVADNLINLSTERKGVEIRQVSVEDTRAMFSLFNHNRDHLSPYYDLESAVGKVVEPRNNVRLRFGIWDGDILVGSINLTPSEETGEVELGYWLGKEHTGKGYATIATRAVANFGMTELGLQKVWAIVDKNNNASNKVMGRSGFVRTGEIENYYLYIFKPRVNQTS